ncbi:type VI secretion system Vgr family protein [Salinivibrio socompensis]|uniref:type VI secretion system Vgr family protein n=2 Tax=Salinivibrio socompensis TaxID=1510206 RepID=UPI000472CFFB|nr:type VI secretion system tip protein TssI/VgrG [Salinivibrio socompensis]
MATLRFSLVVDGLAEDTFVVREYQGHESVSDSYAGGQPLSGYRYDISLASRQSGITADQTVDKKALLTVFRDEEPVQYVHGIVRRFTHKEIGHHHTFYSLILVPSLERLSLRRNSRIFQHQTVKDIISTLLTEMGITDVSFSLKRELPEREFCVQYRESDLAFLHRLAAEEGINYYFTHREDKHTVHFYDDSSLIDKYAKPVEHNSRAGGTYSDPYVRHIDISDQSESNKTVLKDYSFKKPAYSFLQPHEADGTSYQRTDYEHFDAPGRYKNDPNGKAFTRIRNEFLRREASTAQGQSHVPALQAGVKFDLIESLHKPANRDWLVVSVSHVGTQPQALEEEGGTGATTYHNHFKVIPATRQWRATPQPKPQVDGPMIGEVVGPKGEEIFCDEHGRVKVHFPWDRESKQDEHSSCWIRVSQGWAGAQYGFMAVPRIGHEVIVSFLNGDPDQPIITGRTYHATNVPPYLLPNHKTRTVIKTQTHQGEGSNEIRFEDQASIEQIYIHAQKDQDIVTENIHREFVGVDSHRQVGRNTYQSVTENSHRMVGKNVVEEFGQDHHQKIGRNLVQRILGKLSRFISGGMITKVEGGIVTQATASEEKEIGANQRTKVSNESYLTAKNIVLEAGNELTIKGPGGFVKIDGGGITISGTKVKINEGGSPGKGTAPTMVQPDETDKPQQPDDPDRRG